MSASSPTVSAVIPVYNGAEFLAEAVRSVLTQTRPPIECIVVDDGSIDATADVARSFGDSVTHIRQPQQGVAAARNRGVREASGGYVAFLDHDDIWMPQKTELQLDALAGTSGAVMSLCGVRLVDASGTALGSKRMDPAADLPTGMLMFDGTETVSCGSAGVIDREKLLALGGFDEQLGTSADWDLLLRVAIRTPLALVDEDLVTYRVHGLNMSRNIGAMEHDMRIVYDKAFRDDALPSALRRRRRRAYSRLYRMLAGSYLRAGDRRRAFRLLASSVAVDPAGVASLARGRGVSRV